MVRRELDSVSCLRIESSVMSVSWIPSEAIKGLVKLPFEIGVTHYDSPPPDVIPDIEELIAAGAIRFANVLRAWIEVEDGKVVDAGHAGNGLMSSTTVRIGPKEVIFQPLPFPDLRRDPEDVSATAVRFVQSAGGRTGMPAPRTVKRPPFVQFSAPNCWTTLALTLHADGSSEHEVLGASTFPRHWIYDRDGRLVEKIGMTDFTEWYDRAFGSHSPWGDEESPAVVTEVETALERELSAKVMTGGGKPKRVKIGEGDVLFEQGSPGSELYLLLDGVLSVEVDGETVAELGPGAILGERAILEGRGRTSTLRATTPCRLAVVPREEVSTDALAQLSKGHRREQQTD